MDRNCPDILSVRQNRLSTAWFEISNQYLKCCKLFKGHLAFYCFTLLTLINAILISTSLRNIAPVRL